MATLASIQHEQAVRKAVAVLDGISTVTGTLDEKGKVTPKEQTDAPYPTE